MNEIASHIVIAVLVLALLLTSTLSPLSSAFRAQGGDTESLLYIQAAAHGTLTPLENQSGAYQLTLREIGPRASFFSDRPFRDAGTLSHADMIATLFDDLGLNPNAALSTSTPNDDRQVVVAFELSNPSYDSANDQISYIAIPLGEIPEGLHDLVSGELSHPPTEFGEAELFIDSNNWHNCYGNIYNKTDRTFNLDRGSLDPSNSDRWDGGPSAQIGPQGEGKWHFRFHSNSNEKFGQFTYRPTDGSHSFTFHVGCDTSFGSAEIDANNFYCEPEFGRCTADTHTGKAKTGNFTIHN